jgi:hypothetical protein
MTNNGIKAVMVRGPFTQDEFDRIVALVKQIDDERGDPTAVFEIMALGGAGTKIDQLLRELDEDTLSVRVDRV